MEKVFLRVLAVSLVVSVPLLPLLLLRRRLEGRYAPETRWGLWIGIAILLLSAPFLETVRPLIVVEPPAYTVTLPASSPQPVRDLAPMELRPSAQLGAPRQMSMAETAAIPKGETELRTSFSLTELAAGVWLAVAVWLAAVRVFRYGAARRRLLRDSVPAAGMESLEKELELDFKVSFRRRAGLETPMTLGVFRPVILLPEGDAAPLALRHELLHVKRGDISGQVILFAACAFHWFNPLVWYMARGAREDMEAACDAQVAKGLDTAGKRDYGALLIAAAAGETFTPFSTCFGGGADQMRRRLTQLFHPGKSAKVLACLLTLSILLGTALVACQPKQSDDMPSLPLETGSGLTAGDLAGLSMGAVMPELDYLSDTLLVFHDYWGMGIYHVENGVLELVDTAALGMNLMQGDQYTQVSVTGDEKTVYLQNLPAWGDHSGYSYDVSTGDVKPVEQIPEVADQMIHVSEEEARSYPVMWDGWKSNVLALPEGGYAYLCLPPELGDTMNWLQLIRIDAAGFRRTRFLAGTPAGGREYTDADWGFTLRLPENWENRYLAVRGAGSWAFYQTDSYSDMGDGWIFTLAVEEHDALYNAYNGDPEGNWPVQMTILGERDGLVYYVEFVSDVRWNEETRESYQAMEESARQLSADDFRFSGTDGVTAREGWWMEVGTSDGETFELSWTDGSGRGPLTLATPQALVQLRGENGAGTFADLWQQLPGSRCRIYLRDGQVIAALELVRPGTFPEQAVWPAGGANREVQTPFLDVDGIYHGGIDIPAPAGTPVLAALSGRVTETAGDSVTVWHEDGWWAFRYTGLAGITVRPGDTVARGQTLGTTAVWEEGEVLHLEALWGGEPVDPLNTALRPYLDESGAAVELIVPQE